jgi:GNAT superfamily N-acetyltransferase
VTSTQHLDDATLDARARHSFVTLVRTFGAGNPSSSIVELPGGVRGCCVPSSPRLPLLNASCFEDPVALPEQLPELARRYAVAGVTAWSVWVFPGQRAPQLDATLVEHNLGPGPPQELMGMALSEGALAGDAPTSGFTLTSECSWHELARTNELAYGHPPGEYAAVMAPGPAEAPVHRVVARENDTDAVAACAFFVEDRPNAVVGWVATVPSARRRGLAGAVMREGMRRVLAAGCSTVTLDATPAGVPVYERLGFRRLGTIGTWLTGV